MDDGNNEAESMEDLFKEIWERESQAVLHFEVDGVGTVVLTQDLLEERWQVSNFSNTVWEAAIWMHHFFQDERCFPVGWLRGRRVLELGAGTGLVGLTLALLGAEVTMTDLPEALPILRHNANATFGSPSESDGAMCESVDGSKPARYSPRGSRSLLTDDGAKMPTIHQLRWGSSEDAERVAAGAASALTAAAVEAGRQPPEWRGFDLVVREPSKASMSQRAKRLRSRLILRVQPGGGGMILIPQEWRGADIIYNEQTFPLLVETLSDRRLCLGGTIVYLSTMLRGGRHEELLNQLGETFQVRALDPFCADKLRALVACGEDWGGPEWRATEISRQKRTKACAAKETGETRDGREHAEKADSAPSSIICRDLDIPRREDREHSASSAVGAAEVAVGVGLDGRKGLSSVKRSKTKANDRTCDWGYEADGLGKMLAFAARRRPEDWGGLK